MGHPSPLPFRCVLLEGKYIYSHYNHLLTECQIIAEALHGTAIEAFWAGTSFLLSSTGEFEVQSHLVCDTETDN